jgi:flagellar hook-associated protein 1 FlgK
MSGNLFGILNTSRTGLFAQQAGLSVTGNNIANVNTEGYTRQRLVLDAQATGGVQLRGMMRLRDSFVSQRLFGSNARLAARTTLSLNLSQVESVLGDTGNGGLSRSLQDFFNAFQDLSQQPGGAAEREGVRARTGQLISAFSSVTGQLRQLRSQIDQQVQNEVARINDLASRIVELNSQLGGTSATSTAVGDSASNNLLDQRDQLVKELSELAPVRVITSDQGGLTIFLGDQVLLEGGHRKSLSTRVNPSNGGMHEVYLDGLGGGVNLASRLSDGKLAAMLESRDKHIGGALADIERLAAQLMRDVNIQHRLGTGLDGMTGRDFFSGLNVTATGGATNVGGAGVGATSILDDSLLTFNDYEIRFTAPGLYNVVNATTGATLSTGNAYVSGSAIDFDGMRVTIANASGAPAAGDTFHVDSYTGTGSNLTMAAGVGADPGAIAAGLSAGPGDNRNALQLIALREQTVMGQPASQTYEAFFDNLRVRQGMATSAAQQALTDEEVSNFQLVSMADSLSGVSIDEEATHLIQYQRAFQASSRIISATDELLQTLLQMI